MTLYSKPQVFHRDYLCPHHQG